MPAEADGAASEVRRKGSGILFSVLIPLLISGTIATLFTRGFVADNLGGDFIGIVMENGVELERYRLGNIIMLWGMLVFIASLVTVPAGLALAAIASWVRFLMRRRA